MNVNRLIAWEALRKRYRLTPEQEREILKERRRAEVGKALTKLEQEFSSN